MPRRALFDHLWPVAFRAAMVVLALSVAPQVAADAYTDALKNEAQKIDGGPAAPAGASTGAPATRDPTITAFEQELEQHYRGIYLYYKQLPARSREEVFKSYLDGLPMDDVKKMVVDRYQRSR